MNKNINECMLIAMNYGASLNQFIPKDLMKIINCSDCHQQLTDEEIDCYENRCKKCESEWAEEIYLWRNGEANKQFDDEYSLTKPTIM